MTKRNAAIAALTFVCAACDGDARWAGTVRDSAGIAIVENTAEGMWGPNDAPEITTELDIGTADGPPETQFGQLITGVTTDSQGRIYILDQQAQRVRVFDADGEFVRELGGAGTGPGELSAGAAGVLRLAGDTIIVPDILQQRVNRYAPDGSSAGSFPMMMADGIPIRWDITPDHRMIHQVRRFTVPGQSGGEQEAERSDPPGDPIVVRALDGSVQDTLLVLPAGQSFQMTGGAPTIRLFDAEPIWDLGPDGRIYSGMNDRFRIEVRGLDDTLERVITLPFERRPVEESDRETIREAMRELFGQQGVPPQAMQQAMAMIQFADFYPAYATLVAGPNGQLWVQRIRSAESLAQLGTDFDPNALGADEWDVFDGEGRYLGVIQMPHRFTLQHTDGSFVYGVTKDDLDVSHVVRLRIDQ